MTPSQWDAMNWSADNPLAIGFTVIDDLPFGPHPLTEMFQQRLDWFTQQHLRSYGAEGLRIFIALVEAPRVKGRSQWRIHIATTPAYPSLDVKRREAAATLSRRLAELVVSWEEVEDVDATLPA